MLNEIEIRTNESKSLNMLWLNASYHVIEPLDKVLVVSPSHVKNLYVEPEIRDEIMLSNDMNTRIVFCVDVKSRMKQVGWYVSSATTRLILLPLHGPLRLVERRSVASQHTTKKNDLRGGVNIVRSIEMQMTRRGFTSSYSGNVFRWHDTTETFVSELTSSTQQRQRGGTDKTSRRHAIELQVKPNGGFKFK